MTDPTLLVGGMVTIVSTLTISVVTIINALSKMKQDVLAKMSMLARTTEEVRSKVDGTFSDVKAELVTANQRIAVLTERLLTTMPTDKKT